MGGQGVKELVPMLKKQYNSLPILKQMEWMTRLHICFWKIPKKGHHDVYDFDGNKAAKVI
jgi:hypothetical protein